MATRHHARDVDDFLNCRPNLEKFAMATRPVGEWTSDARLTDFQSFREAGEDARTIECTRIRVG